MVIDGLHANFYDDYMSAEQVVGSIEDIKKIIAISDKNRSRHKLILSAAQSADPSCPRLKTHSEHRRSPYTATYNS